MKKCRWTIEDLSGDLKIQCKKTDRELRIIHEIVEATNATAGGKSEHNDILDKLKRNLVRELGCQGCEFNPFESQ